MSAELMATDFQHIETVFSHAEAEEFMADSTGKKANLHNLSRELWETAYTVLWKLSHFSTFQSVEMQNKSILNSVREEALENLYVPQIQNPWIDAHTQFVGKKKRGIYAVDADEMEEEEEENEADKAATHSALPTRKDAIAVCASNEVKVFLGTSHTRTGDAAHDRVRFFQTDITKPRTVQTSPWNTETSGNRRAMIYDPKGKGNPRLQYVNGRNPYRGRVCFQKDDFVEYADMWAILARVGEGPEKEKIDFFMCWNGEQERANPVIKNKLKAIVKDAKQVKQTTLKGFQQHVERRLWGPEGNLEGEVGSLAGLPGMQEELFEAYTGPLPSRRPHKYLQMGGIKDSMYPEEVVPLRNPNKSEPRVLVEVQKMIFPPEDDKAHDGESVIRGDEVWAPSHVCSHFQIKTFLFGDRICICLLNIPIPKIAMHSRLIQHPLTHPQYTLLFW